MCANGFRNILIAYWCDIYDKNVWLADKKLPYKLKIIIEILIIITFVFTGLLSAWKNPPSCTLVQCTHIYISQTTVGRIFQDDIGLSVNVFRVKSLINGQS